MKRLLYTLLISWCSVTILSAQSVDERLNRAMYNRIEFFFNSQQTDSIYQLASPEFRQQVSQTQLSNTLSQLYTLGKIKDASRIGYEKGIAQYKIDFDQKILSLSIGLDETKKQFSTLIFRPYTAKEQPAEQKEETTIAADTEKTDPLDVSVNAIAQSYLKLQNTQALAVAVVHKNKVKKFFYGEAAAESGTPPDEKSMFELGDITKTFTATLLADLVEKGTINLEDSIAKFLPDSVTRNPVIANITFRSLANHTSGLPRLPDNLSTVKDFDEDNPYAHYDRAALFSFLRNFEPKREPEEEYEYSDVGYGLLGELISIITKKSYEQYLKETLLAPLHMNSTSTAVSAKNENLLPVHNASGKKVNTWGAKALTGAAALKSTTDDLLRYAIVQLRRPDNPLEQTMALTKLFTYFIPPNTDIGLGWHMNIIEDVTCYWHHGNTTGSSSYIGLIPDMNSAVIVLSNSATPVEEIAKKIIHETIVIK